MIIRSIIDAYSTRNERDTMYQTIDKTKLADAQSVADKLAKLPEQALLYIAGYAEGVLAMAGKRASAERDGR